MLVCTYWHVCAGSHSVWRVLFKKMHFFPHLNNSRESKQTVSQSHRPTGRFHAGTCSFSFVLKPVNIDNMLADTVTLAYFKLTVLWQRTNRWCKSMNNNIVHRCKRHRLLFSSEATQQVSNPNLTLWLHEVFQTVHSVYLCTYPCQHQQTSPFSDAAAVFVLMKAEDGVYSELLN